MQLKTDKKRVEILLDDRDLNEILSGRSVMLPELGINDQRPLIVSRWLNPELKVVNRTNDLKAIEILTGQNPLDVAKGKAFSTVAPLNAPKPVEVNSRPFALEDKDDAITKPGQATPFSDAREKIGPKIPRSGPSQFGRNFNVERRRKDEDIPGGSKEDRQDTNYPSSGVAGEDNKGG